jgi:hypothetical protein
MEIKAVKLETEFIIRLCVIDFSRSAADLAGQLGVPKTVVWERKDGRQASFPDNHRLPASIWEMEAKSRGSLLLGEHVFRFLEAVGPLRDKLKLLQGEYEVAVRCHLNDYGKGYVIYCDHKIISRLAEINASLEIVIHKGEDEAETPHKNSLDLGFIPEPD